MNIVKKILPFLIIIFLLLIIKGNITNILTTLDNKNTAKNLTQKLQKQKKENQYLKERLTFVKTDKFVAEQAREKLNLLKPGEYFVIAPTESPIEGTPAEVNNKPNWRKWWELFF